MRKTLALLTLSVASLGMMTGQASAMPLVMTGSQYSVYLAGSNSGDALLAQTRFDGIREQATRSSGMVVFFNESETAVGATSSHISLSVSANGDLFPVAGESAVLGIGVDGDGLDFLTSVTLTEARLTFLDENGNVLFFSDNLAGSVDQNFPWDGTFLGNNDAIGIDNVGGMDVANIMFDFYVSEQQQTSVPEPGSLFLSGLGLLGLGAVRRRWGRDTA